MMTDVTTPETQTGHWCEACNELVEPVPLYECSRCSERSDERRCGQCNIFMGRADDGCPECFGEVVETEVVEDHDGTLIPADQYDPDGGSLAEREAAAEAEKAERRAAEAAAKRAAQEAGSAERTWADVSVGDILLIPDDFIEGRYSEARVVDLLVAGTNAQGIEPGTVIALVEEYGARLFTHRPDEVVRIKTGEPEEDHPEVAPTQQRFAVERDARGMWGGSGPRTFEVRVGRGDSTNYGKAPIASIVAIRGNMGSPLGGFYSAEEARAFAAVVRSVADHLPDDGGRRSYDDDVEVTFEEQRFVTTNLSRWVTVRTGQDGDEPLVDIGVAEQAHRGSYTTTFTDRLAVLALAEAAERCALWLDVQYDGTSPEKA